MLNRDLGCKDWGLRMALSRADLNFRGFPQKQAHCPCFHARGLANVRQISAGLRKLAHSQRGYKRKADHLTASTVLADIC